jgi:hypothetical protein
MAQFVKVTMDQVAVFIRCGMYSPEAMFLYFDGFNLSNLRFYIVHLLESYKVALNLLPQKIKI